MADLSATLSSSANPHPVNGHSEGASVHAHDSIVAHHFEDLEQQRAASQLGMWIFLASEVLFFGVLITGYIVYRTAYSAAFHAASHHLNILLGTLNTAVLLTSSLTVALAIHAATAANPATLTNAKPGQTRRRVSNFLLITAALGLLFLVIKGIEWYIDYQENLIPGFNFVWEGDAPDSAELFFTLYFITTGLHALHLLIGVVIATVMAILTQRGWYDRDSMPVELYGLYWHFVDVVWIFVFPFYYLIGRTL